MFLTYGLSGSEMYFQFGIGLEVGNCSNFSENLSLGTAKLPEFTVTGNVVF